MSHNPVPPQNDHDLARLMASFVVKDQGYESPCWVWTGTMFREGYGCFTMVSNGKSRAFRAHRVMWTWRAGEETTRPLDHLCHDPATCEGGFSCPHRACVNPDHLRPVVQRDNVIRGSGPSAINARKETSISGGDLDYVDPRGWRGSKKDRADATKRYYERNREKINAKRREKRERVVYDERPCQECGMPFTPKRSDGKCCTRKACINARQRKNRELRKQTVLPITGSQIRQNLIETVLLARDDHADN